MALAPKGIAPPIFDLKSATLSMVALVLKTTDLAELRAELQARLERAGVDVQDAKLSHLAYAPEIAQVMLRRQQAEAVIAARRKIVTGASRASVLRLTGNSPLISVRPSASHCSWSPWAQKPFSAMCMISAPDSSESRKM